LEQLVPTVVLSFPRPGFSTLLRAVFFGAPEISLLLIFGRIKGLPVALF